MGPIKPGDGKDVADYLTAVRDTSHDDERKILLPSDHTLEVSVKDAGVEHSIRIK